MQKIITFFEYVYVVLKFILNSIIKVGQVLISLFQFLVDAFMALPLVFKAVLVLVVVVAIIYKIISLGGSGE